MIKEVTHAHLETIWYLSEASDASDVPYSPNQFLGWDFFCRFLQQISSSFFLIIQIKIFFPHKSYELSSDVVLIVNL